MYQIDCMKAGVIEQEMTDYFMQLNDAEKKSVVALIKTFIQSRSKQSPSSMLDDYNNDIEESLLEAGRGEFYTHDEVVNLSKSW